jgi:DNA-binding NarL/FixJ family response regulator
MREPPAYRPALATKQVARRLGISPKTCDHHIQRVYGKLGVSTRAGATLFALEHGLVSPDGSLRAGGAS